MNQDAFEALRAFIIKTRQERKLSQADVARRGGIPKGTLGAIEAGRYSIPRQETLQGIAKGLGVPYEVLDRMARGIPPETPSLGSRRIDPEFFRLVDDLPLSLGHRRMVKLLVEEMFAEEQERSVSRPSG